MVHQPSKSNLMSAPKNRLMRTGERVSKLKSRKRKAAASASNPMRVHASTIGIPGFPTQLSVQPNTKEPNKCGFCKKQEGHTIIKCPRRIHLQKQGQEYDLSNPSSSAVINRYITYSAPISRVDSLSGVFGNVTQEQYRMHVILHAVVVHTGCVVTTPRAMTDLCFLISFVARDGNIDKSFNMKFVNGDVFGKIMSKVGTGQKSKSKFLYDHCRQTGSGSLNHFVLKSTGQPTHHQGLPGPAHHLLFPSLNLPEPMGGERVEPMVDERVAEADSQAEDPAVAPAVAQVVGPMDLDEEMHGVDATGDTCCICLQVDLSGENTMISTSCCDSYFHWDCFLREMSANEGMRSNYYGMEYECKGCKRSHKQDVDIKVWRYADEVARFSICKPRCAVLGGREDCANKRLTVARSILKLQPGTHEEKGFVQIPVHLQLWRTRPLMKDGIPGFFLDPPTPFQKIDEKSLFIASNGILKAFEKFENGEKFFHDHNGGVITSDSDTSTLPQAQVYTGMSPVRGFYCFGCAEHHSVVTDPLAHMLTKNCNGRKRKSTDW